LEGVTTSRLIAGATTLRILGAVILAALAVFAALLASDVRAWPFALDRGDAVYAVSPGAASWTPATRLGGVAASLLGVGRDVTSRRALVLYRQVAGQQEILSNALDVETLRVAAETALAAPAASSDPRIASQARTLLGILAFGAASNGGGGASQTDTAISDFTGAVTVDPADTAAKFDLELLLRLTAAHGQRISTGPSNSFGKTGRRAAAGGVPGSGY
jgi:hypothetical protein